MFNCLHWRFYCIQFSWTLSWPTRMAYVNVHSSRPWSYSTEDWGPSTAEHCGPFPMNIEPSYSIEHGTSSNHHLTLFNWTLLPSSTEHWGPFLQNISSWGNHIIEWQGPPSGTGLDVRPIHTPLMTHLHVLRYPEVINSLLYFYQLSISSDNMSYPSLLFS